MYNKINDIMYVFSTKAIMDCIETFRKTLKWDASIIILPIKQDESSYINAASNDVQIAVDKTYSGCFCSNLKQADNWSKCCLECHKNSQSKNSLNNYTCEFNIIPIDHGVYIGKNKVANARIYYTREKIKNDEFIKIYETLDLKSKDVSLKKLTDDYKKIPELKEGDEEENRLITLNSVFANLISQLATQQLTLLVIQNISDQISTSLDIKKTLEPFVQNINRLVHYDMCCIWLVSEDENILTPGATYLESKDENEDFFRVKLERGKGLVGKIMEEDGHKILNTKNEIDKEYPKNNDSIHLKDMRSYMGIAMSFNKKLVGVIELGSKNENAFDEIDKSLIKTFSAQASAYIRNAKITKALIYFINNDDAIYEYVNLAIGKILSLINAKLCSIYLREEAGDGPAYLVATNGFTKSIVLDTSMFLDPKKENKAFYKPGEGLTGWVLANGKTISLPANQDDKDRDEAIVQFNKQYKPNNSPEVKIARKHNESFDEDTTSNDQKALICAPIIVDKSENKNVHKAIYGVIKVIGKAEGKIGEEFSADEKNILEICANCIGMALDIKYAEIENNKRLFDVVAAMAAAIDAKDPYTEKHSRNVQKLCERIGIRLNYTTKELNDLKIAALLHDIGKIGIPDSVLSKPGQFNKAERYMISIHSELGASFIEKIKGLEIIRDGILDHHEFYKGKGGYPGKKKGDEISEIGRIIAVADSFDAITAKRPYKDKTDYETAFIELKKNSGTQFDPKIINAFRAEFGSLYDTMSTQKIHTVSRYKLKQKQKNKNRLNSKAPKNKPDIIQND